MSTQSEVWKETADAILKTEGEDRLSRFTRFLKMQNFIVEVMTSLDPLKIVSNAAEFGNDEYVEMERLMVDVFEPTRIFIDFFAQRIDRKINQNTQKPVQDPSEFTTPVV